jgi:hypothetical protein
VAIQCIMVGLIVAFPGLVTRDAPVATPTEIPSQLDQIPSFRPNEQPYEQPVDPYGSPGN